MKTLNSCIAFLAAATILLSAWVFGGVRFWTQVAVGIAILASVVCLTATVLFDRRDESNSSRLLKSTWHVWPVFLAVLLGCFQATWLPTGVVEWLSPSTTALMERMGKSDLDDVESVSSVSLSVAPDYTRTATAQLALAAAAFVLGTLVFSTEARFRGLLTLVVANGVALSAFGIIQYLTWEGELYWRFPIESAGVFASFVNRNNAGGYLCLCFGAALALLMGQDESSMMIWVPENRASPWERVRMMGGALLDQLSEPKRLAMLLGVVVIGGGIVASLSRGASVALVVGTVAVALSASKRGKRLFLVMSAGVLLLAIGLAAFLGRLGAIWDRFTGGLLRNSKDVVRPQHWAEALHAFADYPFFGTGLGTYELVSPMYQRCLSDAWFQHAENQFLEAFVEGGILGGGLLMVALGFVVHAAVRLRRNSASCTDSVALSLASFTIVSQVVSSFFDFGLYLPANAFLFALLSGAFVGWSSSSRPSKLSVFATLGTTIVIVSLAVVELRSVTQVEMVGAYESVRPNDTEARLVPSEPMAWSKQTSQLAGFRAAVEARPFDSRAHRMVAESLIGGFRRSALAQIDENEDFLTEPLWIRTDPVELFRLAAQWKLEGDESRLKIARKDPHVRKYLVPAFDQLIQSRHYCPLSRGVQLRLAQLSMWVDRDPIPHIRRARSLAPASSATAIQCGYMLLLLGQSDEGLELLRSAVELNEHVIPHAIDSVVSLGLDVDDLRLPKDPLILVRIADEDCREPAWAATKRLLMDLALMAVQDEESEFEESVRRYVVARFLEMSGQFHESQREMEAAISLKPDAIDWRFRMALLMERNGEFDSAVKELQYCLSQMPGHPPYRSALHRIKQKHWQEFRLDSNTDMR